MDNLNDKVLAVKMSIADRLIPAMTNYLILVGLIYDAHWRLNQAHEDGIITQEEYNRAFTKMGQIGVGVNKVLDDNRAKIQAHNWELDIAAGKYGNLGNSEFIFQMQQQVTSTSLAEGTAIAEDYAEALAKIDGAYIDLTFDIQGLVTSNQEYGKTQADVKRQLDETKAKIQELEALPRPSKQQKEDLEGLKTTYLELWAIYGENAKKHEEMTNKIIYDITAQTLAMDGLTAEEADLLIATAEGLGLVNSASAEAARKIQSVMKQVQSGAMTAAQAIQKVKDILDSVKSKTVTVKIRYTSSGAVLPSGAIADATGGEARRGSVHRVGEYGAEPFIPAEDGRILSVSEAKSALVQAQLSGTPSSNKGGGLFINNLIYMISNDMDVQRVYYNLQDMMLSAAKGQASAKFLRS
jgi:hypothetical protein